MYKMADITTEKACAIDAAIDVISREFGYPQLKKEQRDIMA